MKKGRCFIGTSGWYYHHWSGCFYPEEIPKDELLPFFAQRFSTVELNNTFYHLPKEEVVKGWREKTPENFVFAIKASRFITHIKRLGDLGDSLNLFLERARLLGDKKGPLLYQLPPSMKKDLERLKGFLKRLPRQEKNVIEFRHQSWLDDEVLGLCAQFKVAHCIVSMPDFPTLVEKTANFAYIRMHGGSALYSSKYTEDELKKCAEWVQKFRSEGADSYVYFNNDAQGYAIENALRLKELVKN